MIGQLLAELPVQIGAEIRRSPVMGISYDNLFELIANVDCFYFLMGQDITVLGGAEWLLAIQLERSMLPLRRAGALTAVGQEFLRFWPLGWKTFRSRGHLAQIIGLDLIRFCCIPPIVTGLSITEVASLHAHKKKLSEGMSESLADGDEPGGAEGGGILLDITHRDENDANESSNGSGIPIFRDLGAT